MMAHAYQELRLGIPVFRHFPYLVDHGGGHRLTHGGVGLEATHPLEMQPRQPQGSPGIPVCGKPRETIHDRLIGSGFASVSRNGRT